MDFKPGDVVQLKSGGPLMTVAQSGKDMYGRDMVWCTWFQADGKKQENKKDTFPPTALKKGEG